MAEISAETEILNHGRHTLVHHQFRSRTRLDPYDSLLIPHNILLKRYSNAGNSGILILPPPPPQNDEEDDDDYRKLSPLVLQNLIDYRPEHEHEKKGKGKFMLLDSCNGLLLYTYRLIHQIHIIGKHIWYICNPITHDYIKLPTFEQEEKEQGFRILSNSSPNIVFDPSSLSSLIYKVVTWLNCQSSRDNLQEHYRLYVYSSETRSWKLSISTNEFPVDPRQFNFVLRGKLCNGVLYWNALVPSLDVSLCYDVEKDMISTLKFPNVPVGYRHRTLFYFGECGGGLRLIENYYKQDERINVFPSIFDVMELNVDQQQQHEDLWTVKYRVNIIGEEGYYASLIKENPLSGVFILDLYKTKTKNTEEEEEVLLLRIKNIGIISFNLSRNTFGKELRNAKKKPIMSDLFLDFTEVLRYNTITLFPPSSSL